MKNSQPRGGKEEMSDVHECAESPKTSCARGNCLTLQTAVSCCKSVDALVHGFSVGGWLSRGGGV